MPTAPERVEAVFQPIPLLSKLSRSEISALNVRLRVLYSGLRGRREATAVSMVESMDSTMQSVHATLFLGMLRTNAPDRISNHLATLYSSQKLKGDTVRQTMVRVEKEARSEKSTEFFRDVLWDSFGASGADYAAGLNIIRAYQALIWEDTRARFIEAASGFDSFITMLKYGGVQKAFSASDFETVDLIYGQPPQELLEIVENRDNLITLPGFVDADFEQLRGVMITDFYAGAEGPIGARAIASKMRKTLGASGNIPNHKWMLWARTEGAVAQNDTLRKIGRDAEMDGKIWISVGPPNPPRRDAHEKNEADGVIPVDQLYDDGSTDGGSGSKSPFNCFAPEQVIGGVCIAASRATYVGDMITIETRKGHRLRCTPQHPILTDTGFSPAATLRNGDHLVCGPSEVATGKRYVPRKHYIDDVQRNAEQIFKAFSKRSKLCLRDVSALDFHGDGLRCKGDIDVVRAEGSLSATSEPTFCKECYEKVFTLTSQRAVRSSHLACNNVGSFSHSIPLDLLLFRGRPKRYTSLLEVAHNNRAWAIMLGSKCVNASTCNVVFDIGVVQDLPLARYGDPSFAERAVDNPLMAASLFSQCRSTFPGQVLLDDIVSVHVSSYSGYVYDVESSTGIISAGGIICKQCRCSEGPAMLPPKR